MKYIAHKRNETDNKEQTLAEHLENVANLSSEFAQNVNMSDYAKLIGLLHDIGKYSFLFQRKIKEDKKIRVDHSTCGAKIAFAKKLIMASFCIAGHHGGIPDIGHSQDTAEEPTLIGRMKKKTEDFSDWKNEIDETGFPVITEPFLDDNVSFAFATKLLFSCLVDADYLDTENFMSDGIVQREHGYELSSLLHILNDYIAKWKSPKSKLNILRTEMLNQCIQAAQNTNQNIFTLTVPTGGGKTISSMAFALNYAQKHMKKRIIYVIPYTSIIEQNAKVFRGIFGDNNVLECHSNVDYESINDETKEKLMLASENWDYPIIVTTAVQFFESIFSNKPSKSRKIHNIANSVVIFDEAQLMPLDYLLPCVTAIEQLAENYNSAVVLCTATQPNLQTILNFTNNKGNTPKITEICKSSENLADDFRRADFKYDGNLEDDNLVLEIKRCSQVLCIVNTKKHAQKIFSLLGDSDENFHLSTDMYPAHRQKVLETIKNRLNNGEPCRVVSTSLIEAGVDIDFPTVYRAITGIDSILQAGGRCNRENKRKVSQSVVHIFNTDEVLLYQQTNTDAAMEVIRKFGDKIYLPEAVKMYFENLYYYRDIDKSHKVFDKKIS
ncbi:MAG: CRISPR-associated helicase Cas3' [Ruminococcus sp.]